LKWLILEPLEKLAGKGLERFDFAMPGAYVKRFWRRILIGHIGS
jgi:hypothetical protein